MQISFRGWRRSLQSFLECLGAAVLEFLELVAWGLRWPEPLKFVTNTFSYLDSVSITKGRHSLDLGVDIGRYQENMLRTTWTHGQADWFSPLKNFLTAGQPGYCTGAANCRGISSLIATHALTAANGYALADPYRGYRQTLTAWYVQDNIELLPNLTLNLGVRWGKITPPVEVNGKTANLMDILRDSNYEQLGKEPLFQIRDILGGFMPRFGFAYSPDTRTSVRGGFGLFKEDPLFYQFSVAVFHPPWANRVQLRDLKTWPNPLAGTDPSKGIYSPTIINYDYKYPYAMQWNFGIERQFGENWVARASYIGTRGVNLGSVVNHVQPALSIDANGVPFTQRGAPSINPALNDTRTFANIGNSWYNALQLRIQKRFSKGLEFSASHTWSKNISQAAGLGVTGGEGGNAFQVSNLWDDNHFDRGGRTRTSPKTSI
ncbi:MAG: TonB-dependent receptor [Acidobacteria bacterium]|nr:TonB-dependent receptor [Acidobacteriota bacterium]